MGHFLSRVVVAGSLAGVLSLPLVAAARTWQIDPNHSAAQFAVRHLGLYSARRLYESYGDGQSGRQGPQQVQRRSDDRCHVGRYARARSRQRFA